MNAFHEAFQQMRRTPYQVITAVLMLSITFFVAYIFSFLLMGSERILSYFETRPQVTAFFKQTATDDQVSEIATAMREKSYVSSVRVITKDEALALYRADNQKDPLALELVTADILPASIEVSGVDVHSLEQIQQDLNQTPSAIEEVVFQKDIVDALAKWTNAIRIIGIGIIGILMLVSFLTIIVIIGMKVAMKRQEIAIMGLLGATPWYIARPFLFEGCMYGCIGSFIGWGISVIGLLYATPWIVEFVENISLVPVPWQILLAQVGLGTLIAMLLGTVSSLLALRRFRR